MNDVFFFPPLSSRRIRAKVRKIIPAQLLYAPEIEPHEKTFVINYPARLCIDGRILWLKARLARGEKMHIADVLQRRFHRHLGLCRRCEKGGPDAVIYPCTLSSTNEEAKTGRGSLGAGGPVGRASE